MIAQAAIQAGSIRAAKATPALRVGAEDEQVGQVGAGGRSKAALAMNTEPYRNGRSSSLRRRAACTSTGVEEDDRTYRG